jgi:hypothetical protein
MPIEAGLVKQANGPARHTDRQLMSNLLAFSHPNPEGFRFGWTCIRDLENNSVEESKWSLI